MGIGREQVEHVARLARLAFDEDELERLTRQLSNILDHAEQVSALTTDDVPPTSHAVSLPNVFRPDEVRPCLPQEKVLALGPEIEDDRFRVPRIIEEEP